jgi:thioredoxin-related protein/Tfp pilus assembly protein PilF
MKLRRIVPAGVAFLLICSIASIGVVRAEEGLWVSDFEAAKAKAKAEKKKLLVDFTGSDWCGWCIKLRGEVFDKDAFKNEAPKKFVLVEIDFPNDKTKLTDEVKKQNEKLGKEYKIQGYPSILLMDDEGKVIAHTGYRPDGPEKYNEHLDDLLKTWDSIVQLKADLEKAEGLDRVKALDQIVEGYDKLGNESDELLAWSKEIVALDPENKSGLKIKYALRVPMIESAALAGEQKFAEAIAVLDKAAEIEGLSGEQKQDVYFTQVECYFQMRDLPGLMACLKKGIDAAPEGPKAPQMKAISQRFAPAAEAVETIAKKRPELEKAEGLDRAKIIDELIEAYAKVGMFAASVKGEAPDIAAWTKEIATLDADNKAGLKNKYEFKQLVTDAGRQMVAKKFDEAEANIEKALALTGIAPEQMQDGLMAKGNLFLMQKDYDKSLETFKKALEAAPESPRAAIIKRITLNVEQQQKADEDAKKKDDDLKKEESEKK